MRTLYTPVIIINIVECNVIIRAWIRIQYEIVKYAIKI